MQQSYVLLPKSWKPPDDESCFLSDLSPQLPLLHAAADLATRLC